PRRRGLPGGRNGDGLADARSLRRRWEPVAIGAITVVLPITFLISSIGMAIGVGGASIISRAFGQNDNRKACATFGNQVGLTLFLAILFVAIGRYYQAPLLALFGGKGDIAQPASIYFEILLLGVPFLAWAMMSNNVIRALGHPKMAMFTLIVPAIVNLVLDPIMIVVLDMGIAGAAWATTLSYTASAIYTTWFFLKKQHQIVLNKSALLPNLSILKEMTALGSVTLARQGTISVLSIILNNTLFTTGGELALSTYGIINRAMMVVNFPVLGITQGFVPILGFNYGAELFERVQKLVKLSIKSATLIAMGIFALIMLFTNPLVRIFTTETALIEATVPALRIAFLATPLIAMNLIGSAYYQAIGKAKPALLLALTKQGFFLIPLLLTLPLVWGIYGIWAAFPIADVGAALITYWYLQKGLQKIEEGQVVVVQQKSDKVEA
ncbi:MAG: MATE family efflux transporter, partial [Bacteroidota bacterium]